MHHELTLNLAELAQTVSNVFVGSGLTVLADGITDPVTLRQKARIDGKCWNRASRCASRATAVRLSSPRRSFPRSRRHGPPAVRNCSRTVEQLHAHNLQLILLSTHSFLAYHAPHIKDGRSLRILDLALLSAIAYLQEFGASVADDNPPVQRAPKAT